MCNKLYRKNLFQRYYADPMYKKNEDLYCNFLLFDNASSAIYEDFCGYRYRQHHETRESVEALIEILNIRRSFIDMCSDPVRKSAYHLWLSTLVNTLNKLSVSTDKGASDCYQICREQLKSEKQKLHMLSTKQQIAAKIHLNFRASAKIIYEIYGKYSQYRFEH